MHYRGGKFEIKIRKLSITRAEKKLREGKSRVQTVVQIKNVLIEVTKVTYWIFRRWLKARPAICFNSQVGVSCCGHAVRALDLRVELRRLVAVSHAVIANDADPSVAQLAKVRSYDWYPASGRFGIPPCNEKQ
jgi:hypothetical protein